MQRGDTFKLRARLPYSTSLVKCECILIYEHVIGTFHRQLINEIFPLLSFNVSQ